MEKMRWRNALEVGRQVGEEVAHILRANHCPAPLDVPWPSDFDFVAPSLLKVSNPVVACRGVYYWIGTVPLGTVSYLTLNTREGQ